MKRKKISIIGAGFVGSSIAHWLVQKELADIVLIDIKKDVARGKALDLYQSTPIENVDIQVHGDCDYQYTKDSDIVIITAGSPRKPGMSRDDLLKINGKVVLEVCNHIKQFASKAVVIVVSNPLDAMTYQALKVLNFSKNKVMGMAGILDTARFRSFIAKELNVSIKDVQTVVLGGHGDTMVPVLSRTFVGSCLLADVLSADKIDNLVQRTRQGGGEIVKLLKTGSAYFAPSRGAVEMAEAILKDQKRVLPCTVFLEGEYGYKDIYIGVPCQLGAEGVEKIIEVPLLKEEKDNFEKSVQSIYSNQQRLKELFW